MKSYAERWEAKARTAIRKAKLCLKDADACDSSLSDSFVKHKYQKDAVEYVKDAAHMYINAHPEYREE